MQLTKAIQQLSTNDQKLIGRDSFLLAMLAYSIFISIVLRFVFPYLNTLTIENESVPFELASYYPMLMGFFVVFMAALFAGMVMGFVLLEEKDDSTIKAMLVTPMPMPYYIAYRIAFPAVLTLFLVVVEMLIVGLAQVDLWQLVLIGFGSATIAPIVALFFATFAQNKVQGFALTKFTGLAGVIIMAAWFIEPPLQWLFGLFPPYLIVKAYWMALDGIGWWWAILLLGVVLNSLIIAALAWRFNQVVYNT